jgi:hypothetical protein
MGANDDQRRALSGLHSCADRRVDRLQVIPVRDPLYLPAVGLESPGRIGARGERGGAFDSDAVVVVEADQLAETKMTGQGRGLMGDALHEIAVAGDKVGAVIDHRVSRPVEHRGEMGLGERHAHRVTDPLAQRAGGGLDTGCHPVLGMSGRLASPLAEALQLAQRQVVTGEMEHAVKQQ